eukprot:m.6635 g.6635  ORF g.6635 m.6635 type:complete len:274 (-) comp2625_c0_seq1:72-893(-)
MSTTNHFYRYDGSLPAFVDVTGIRLLFAANQVLKGKLDDQMFQACEAEIAKYRMVVTNNVKQEEREASQKEFKAFLSTIEGVEGEIESLMCCGETSEVKEVGSLNTMQLVVPNVYIGSCYTASDKELLESNGITHVCSCFNMDPPFPKLFTYKVLQANDCPTQNIAQYFNETNAFISNAVGNGGRVLVHCAAGISRAATITLAYMMFSSQLTLEQAFSHLKQVRNIICPNNGFLEQLQEYEFKLRYGPAPLPTLSESEPQPQSQKRPGKCVIL